MIKYIEKSYHLLRMVPIPLGMDYFMIVPFIYFMLVRYSMRIRNSFQYFVCRLRTILLILSCWSSLQHSMFLLLTIISLLLNSSHNTTRNNTHQESRHSSPLLHLVLLYYLHSHLDAHSMFKDQDQDEE